MKLDFSGFKPVDMRGKAPVKTRRKRRIRPTTRIKPGSITFRKRVVWSPWS